jgi:hypothetical protein
MVPFRDLPDGRFSLEVLAMSGMDGERMRSMEAAGRDIAKSLQVAFDRFQRGNKEKWGFALMIFSFDGPEFTWISNAQRATMVEAMQEFINRNPPDQVSADRN